MKILYLVFHNYVDLPYHTREWVEAALKLGHEVDLVTSVDPAFLLRIGWGEGAVEHKSHAGVGAGVWAGVLRIHQVAYPESIPAPWRYLILERRFRREIERVIRAQEPDIAYERFSVLSRAGADLTAKYAIPYSMEVNGILGRELGGGFLSLLKNRFHRFVERKVASRCRAIIAVTSQIRDSMIEDFGISGEKIIVIPNGVNPERFAPKDKFVSRRKYGIPEDAFVLGFLGSLFPWQNLQVLIDIAPKLIKAIPNFFCMIGGGQEPILSQLRELVHYRGLTERFLLPGQIPWDDAAEFISCFDVAVAPIWQERPGYEFSPLKLTSYMACECPFIATAALGIEELLDDSAAGFSFSFGDADDLSLVIEKTARMSELELQVYGRRGREYVLEHLSWQRLVQRTLGFIVGEKGAGA